MRPVIANILANAVGTVLFALAWASSATFAMWGKGLLADTSRMNSYEKLRYEAGRGDFIVFAIAIWLTHSVVVALARLLWPETGRWVFLIVEIIAGIATWAIVRIAASYLG